MIVLTVKIRGSRSIGEANQEGVSIEEQSSESTPSQRSLTKLLGNDLKTDNDMESHIKRVVEEVGLTGFQVNEINQRGAYDDVDFEVEMMHDPSLVG
ncbi:hypothetical protein V6N11_013786 [Hibiscus sabdariffa]|uniref:Uncharacterized protein n=1 Tax=Hibiscus sabdariffa TaxID=183260 RepID=A0ABR2PCX9_9ROSI